MPWNLLGHIGLLTLWGACGLAPWFAALVASRGRVGLMALPVSMVAGMAGGVIVPVFAKGWTGFAVSLVVATAAGAVASAAIMIRATVQEEHP